MASPRWLHSLTGRNTKWWQWVVQGLVVLLISALVVFWVQDKSFGAEAKAGPCAYVHPQPSRMACHFNHGDYGRSRDPQFSSALRTKMIRAYHRKYGTSKMTGAAWFRQFDGDLTCVPIAGWLVQCTEHPPEITKTEKIIVGCGGSAVAGSLRGGGWWGAGIGGTTCLWGLLMSAW